METVVLDKFLVIGFGSVITILLALVSYLLKQGHQDLKNILEDHEKRIQAGERHRERIEERHVNTSAVVEEIKTKLDLIYERGK